MVGTHYTLQVRVFNHDHSGSGVSVGHIRDSCAIQLAPRIEGTMMTACLVSMSNAYAGRKIVFKKTDFKVPKLFSFFKKLKMQFRTSPDAITSAFSPRPYHTMHVLFGYY